MRVNRRHSDADHFKIRAGKSFAQKNLEITACAERGIGITLRSRFAKEKNAIGVRRLFGGHAQCKRGARDCWWKESESKAVVGNVVVLASNALPHEKRG